MTRTITVTQRDADLALPLPVVRKRYEILAAAYERDFEAVARLASSEGFAYTYGGTAEGGPAAYWRRLERTTDERPLATLAAILRMPYTLYRGVYVWPFAYDKSLDELTAYELKLLRPIAGGGDPRRVWAAGTGYLGWRAGIEPDGDWIFFIAGD